jgi:WD40 repeat protein
LAAFSPDGQRIVTASSDWAAWVWEATTGKQIARLIHKDAVTSAAFSPDGQRIVTASSDGTARVWDARWLTEYRPELTDAVCRVKLIGASRLTPRDISSAPVILGREGEDVCSAQNQFQRFTTWLRGTRR